MSKKKTVKTVGYKKDAGKNRMGLLPPFALERIGEVMTFGAEKYEDWNWSKGMLWSRAYDALQRHLNAWQQRKESDPETGKSHLHHAGACIMMLIELEEFHKELDDRPTHYDVKLKK